jgi:hypothetical protein
MQPRSVVVALSLVSFTTRARADDLPAATPAPVAQTPTDEAIARQAAQIDALRADLEAQKHARSEHPAVRFSGFVQVDWIVNNQASQNEISDSNGSPLNQDRFTLRRGHLRVDVDHGPFSGVVETDANTTNGPQVRPIEAELSARWPERPDEHLPSLVATAGLMRIPFGFEVQELDWVRPFLERGNVLQALFPGEFDLGVQVRARYRFIDWGIALMNGSPIGSKIFPDLDPVHQKDLVGRIGVDILILPGVRFRGGVSADSGTGFHPGTPTTKDVVVWQDADGDGVVQPNEITVIPGSAATPSQTFHRFALGGDAQLAVAVPLLGALTLRSEVVSASNMDRGYEVADPIASGRDLREVGWALGATQEVTRWATIGLRYDRYNPDADANAQRGVALVPVDRSYSTLALMAMARSGDQRLLLEYDVNTNPLGISASGTPTTLADNVLTVRAQLVF